MIEAEVRRKLPALLDNEDSLTSSVFGLLKYSPLRPILSEFLGNAALMSDGTRLGAALAATWPFGEKGLQIRFWERDGQFGEPDLIFVGRDCVIVVEVKLWAEVSGENQLRKYHDLLKTRFPHKRHRHVIYLTKDVVQPDLGDAVTHGIEQHLWWLSWYALTPALEARNTKDPVANEMAADLKRLFVHRGLMLFQRITPQTVSLPTPVFWNDTAPLITQQDGWPLSAKIFWKESI